MGEIKIKIMIKYRHVIQKFTSQITKCFETDISTPLPEFPFP